MSIFFPHERCRGILDISVPRLLKQGFRGIILDVDNTLTTHDNPRPAPGVLEWLDSAKRAGMRLIILSNNSPERVRPFAEMLHLDFESNGKKPLPSGYRRAIRRIGLDKRQTLTIGDQIFTDVLGAKLAGVYCILVDPIEIEGTAFFRFKRRLERPILARFERRKIR